MSSQYPLLTVKNLQYWYWECEPGYSLLDIAKVTGASYSRVQRFMEKHGIPRRERSEAGKNRFECEHKKLAFLETVQSEEHREKQSITSKRVWSDPKKLPKSMIKMPKLRILRLYGNDLKPFPEHLLEIKSLEQIYFGHRIGKNLPDEIGDFKRSKFLSSLFQRKSST